MQRIRINGIKDILLWIILPILTIGVLVLFDQLTKVWFTNLYKENGSTVFIKGVLSFTHTINTGSAFSFLSGKEWAQTFFKVITIVSLLLFVVLYLYALSYKYKTLTVGTSLIVAGTIGNFIDRIVMNGVIDFIRFDFISFPIFNLADICLTFGVIIFIVHFFFLDENAVFKKQEKKEVKEEK
jgi:signal peptidase II